MGCAATFEGPGHSSGALALMRPLFLQLLFASALLVACEEPAGRAAQQPPEGSLAWVEQRILENPNDASLYAQRAQLLERVDSTRAAEEDWKRAISLDEDNADYRLGLGDLLFRKVRLTDAEQRFQEAVALAPSSVAARTKLSELYLAQNRFTEAMTVANDALRLDPQDAKTYNLKGWIHRTAGDTDLAISSYQTAVERDPGLYDAYISLGILHAARRDPLALAYYDNALALRPSSVEALYDKGICAQDMGQDSLALALYARIKEVEPRYPLAYYNSGFVLLEMQGKRSEARAEFTRAIQLLPDYVDAYYSRGLTYEQEGKLDSALADYQQALRLAPGHTDAAKGLGRLEDRGVKVTVR